MSSPLPPILRIAALFLIVLAGCQKKEGKILDATSNNPVAGATIFHNGRLFTTDASGAFTITRFKEEKPLLIKASGYRQLATNVHTVTDLKFQLEPFYAKGLYLAYGGLGFKVFREHVLKTADDAKLNTIVIDVKGDRGLLSFPINVQLAGMCGALSSPTIDNIDNLVRDLHKKHFYLIGRIAVFRDPVLAKFRADWTVKNAATGKAWIDGSGSPWLDPFIKDIWDYNVAVAAAAAETGFDEIQFDFLRFPSIESNLSAEYSRHNTFKNRVEAITGFLGLAQKELAARNVFVSAVTSGFSPWTHEGGYAPVIEEEAKYLDYVSPTLFPSVFKTNEIPGLAEAPVAAPGRVVALAIERAQKRIENPRKVRPYLQAYSEKDVIYAQKEIKLQIQPCESMTTGGWLLWDPANKYTNIFEAPQTVGSVTK